MNLVYLTERKTRIVPANEGLADSLVGPAPNVEDGLFNGDKRSPGARREVKGIQPLHFRPHIADRERHPAGDDRGAQLESGVG